MAGKPVLPGIVDARLLRAYEKARKYLGAPGVTGLSVGRPEREGIAQDQLGIILHVKKKLPESELPTGLVLPREIDGVRVDVVSSWMTPHRAGPA